MWQKYKQKKWPQNTTFVFGVREESKLERTASGNPEWLPSTPEITLGQSYWNSKEKSKLHHLNTLEQVGAVWGRHSLSCSGPELFSKIIRRVYINKVY